MCFIWFKTFNAYSLHLDMNFTHDVYFAIFVWDGLRFYWWNRQKKHFRLEQLKTQTLAMKLSSILHFRIAYESAPEVLIVGNVQSYMKTYKKRMAISLYSLYESKLRIITDINVLILEILSGNFCIRET